MTRQQRRSTLFPYTTLFRSAADDLRAARGREQRTLAVVEFRRAERHPPVPLDDATLRAQRARTGRAHELRSEEHTSELQSHHDLVCRLLLEKKNAENTYVLT